MFSPRRFLQSKFGTSWNLRCFATKINFQKDYYRILDLETNVPDSEIRNRYIDLAKKYHPDGQIEKSEEEQIDAIGKFLEIQEAYEILGNENLKDEYDSIKLKKRRKKQMIYQMSGDQNPDRNIKEKIKRATASYTESDFASYRKEEGLRQYKEVAQQANAPTDLESWKRENERMDKGTKLNKKEMGELFLKIMFLLGIAGMFIFCVRSVRFYYHDINDEDRKIRRREIKKLTLEKRILTREQMLEDEELRNLQLNFDLGGAEITINMPDVPDVHKKEGTIRKLVMKDMYEVILRDDNAIIHVNKSLVILEDDERRLPI